MRTFLGGLGAGGPQFEVLYSDHILLEKSLEIVAFIRFLRCKY